MANFSTIYYLFLIKNSSENLIHKNYVFLASSHVKVNKKVINCLYFCPLVIFVPLRGRRNGGPI